MVLNLVKIREDRLQPIFLRMFNEGIYRTVDQCILNKVFNGKVRLMSAKWNHIVRPLKEMHQMPREYAAMYRDAESDPALVHYAGSDLKPWNTPGVPFSALFWKYCAISPYFKHFMDVLQENCKYPNGRQLAGVLLRGNDCDPYPPHLQKEKEIQVIRQSNAFDVTLYLTENSDVALDCVDPIAHYVHHGEREYRRPSDWFSAVAYKSRNPDITDGFNAFAHYLQFGIFENRPLN